MAIDRKDYNILIGKGTHLKRHKDKINAFLFRMQNGGGVKKSNTLLLFLYALHGMKTNI
ncbi:hypothetical protein ACM1X7_000391 [Campylobacter jejuni]